MKYTVLYANRISELIEEVNEGIRLGWKPIGGIAAAFDPTDPDPQYTWAQAMVTTVHSE